MHYDFKKKLNKVDSQQHKNLLVPEIDWVLNEACEIFVKMIAMPRTFKSVLGFESDQRTIEDIKNIVENSLDPVNQFTVTDNMVTLPENYWYYLSSDCLISKGTCTNKKARAFIRQHDDMFEESHNDRSSFEWRTINGVFTSKGIRLFTDNTFTISKLHLNYIRKIKYMHNAEDFRNGTYALPSGTTLVGTQDCELSPHTHREIVDIAVLITTGEIQSSDYQIKRAKLDLTQ